MRTFRRTIYDHAPTAIEIPPELRQRRVEVIIIPLEDDAAVAAAAQPTPAQAPEAVDALGWPAGFFAATGGQWQGEPLVRVQPATYTVRANA